jgi:putative peptide zinc metalloprotease protein
MFYNPQDEVLPILREDLKLLEASPAEDGSKQWMLFDPILNKYYTIGYDSFELISKWRNGEKVSDFIQHLNENNYELDDTDLITFINFLKNNNLVKSYSMMDAKRLYQQKKMSKQGLFKWLIHNYLFIRIPIFKPNKWLDKMYPKVSFLYSQMWTNIVLFLGFIGVLMALRQWEEFSTTFMYLFSKEGILFYFLSLIFVKSMHELGHAFTAKRYGCKVPTMGVALLVLFPVMYTDTTNSYALKSKYKRLRIVLAGMKVELYLAMIATFLWSFLPDGSLRSVVFIIATTSWITSLLVNISPFLRFDGYYALSDWSNTKNLQPRSFATTKWFLRKYLLGADDVEPEHLPLHRKRFFIIYAICTWIYRFFLFLGIAVLVYYFAFKALGILLFLVEIFWFILIPILNELKKWWEMKEKVSWNKRNKISLSIFVLIILLLVFPWRTQIQMPAIITSEKLTDLYSSKPAFIKEINIKNGQKVNKGDTLLVLESESLDYAIISKQKELKQFKYELKQIVSNEKNLENRFIIEENILKKQQELDGLIKSKSELTLKAPFEGYVYFTNTFNLKQWVSPKEPIITIYNPDTSKIIAYCKDNDLNNLKKNLEGKFIARNGELNTINAKITNISYISLSNLEYEELSSTYGGEIATRQTRDGNGNGQLVSENAYFKIEAKIEDKIDNFKTRVDGEYIVRAQSKSILQKVFQKAYNIIVKESSF